MRHDFRDGYVLYVDSNEARVYVRGRADDTDDVMRLWAQNMIAQHI